MSVDLGAPLDVHPPTEMCPPVDVRLLGDIELRIHGRPADIGHARQQCVLVALLMDADRVVPLDQLLFRVWGDDPPQRAREALYSYLSRLRQILAGGSGATIMRQPGGYRLALDPMLVDAHRFQSLVAQARRADEGLAAGLLHRALGLWRGDAFSTLDTPWLTGVREALNGQRLTAFLDRNDHELAHGRHASVVDDLCAWSKEYALDERLTGQLLLALYRCGRQGDALRVYHTTMLRLADELGADPSPPLRLIHQRILTSDPGLGAPSVRDPAASTPHQLPAAPTAFVGRAGALAELDDIMASGSNATRPDASAGLRIAAIGGAGGIGKTWLAVAWAHRNVDGYPDGQLYVDLKGFDQPGTETAPATALGAMLGALGVPADSVPTGVEARSGLYRSLLAGRRMLVLLDNARDTAQVTPLLPGAEGCAVLVTSRNQLAGLVTAHGARPLSLGTLTRAEAHQVLARHLGAARLAREPESVDELLTACGGLPLALGIVATRATMRGGERLADLATDLRQSSTRLDGFDVDDLPASLRTVFAASCLSLPPDVARAFRLLGRARGSDIGEGTAASLTSLPLGRVRGVLRRLVAASLISECRPGRYRMHDLMQLYAAELAEDTERADAHG